VNWPLVVHTLGRLAGIMAAAMVPSLGIAVFAGDPPEVARAVFLPRTWRL
jgi:hypothetical protein